MKRVQKVLALLMTVILLCSSTLALAAGSGYKDVPANHWAYDVITKWSGEYDVLQGDNGTFSPANALKLGELAAILTRTFGYTARTEVRVTPAWADEYVEKAVAAGVIEKTAAINADIALTREQAVRYIAVAYGVTPLNGATTFADDAEIGNEYKPYVNAFQRLGYVAGTGNNMFSPKAPYTRAEAMKVIDNISKPGIKAVTTIGFVDTDGAKTAAIAVEYNVDLTGAVPTADLYEMTLNNPTKVTKIYVNDKPEIAPEGGSGKGNYVIIEVDTDYLMSSEQNFVAAMAAGVTQKAALTCNAGVIPASKGEIGNYVVVEKTNNKGKVTRTNTAAWGTYTIEGIEGFKYYTNNTSYGAPDGPAYHVEDCFDEKTGEYNDHDVGYALFIPEDYNANGKYAMVVIDNPAVDNENTHPLESVLTTRSPALLASEWGQNQVKENHGLDGLIVVVPVVAARVDDNACTPSQYEALLALWDHIQDEYAIDENHVYGIGQSVGGMVLMETNRNRDNYFAGILMFENQWVQNYYKDTLFIRNMLSDEATAAKAPMHYPRVAADVTWDYYFDSEGNKVYDDHDPYNLYYLVSDDNIMVMNRDKNNLSNGTWREMSYLYEDTVGYSIEQLIVSDTTIEEQEAQIKEYLANGNTFGNQEMGLYWVTFENGSNGYSARKVLTGYEWLLSQSRQTAMEREKLDVNKPFELAGEQIKDDSRIVPTYTDTEGNPLYYKTAKKGSGTQLYNSSWLNLTTVADGAPGWLPEGMSWGTGVELAQIQSVTAINNGGKLTAVAVEYSADMEGLVINLVGDDIIGVDGTVRGDIKIIRAPYVFYDESGKEIECTIKNVYVNSEAAVKTGAARESGNGTYVIVELETASTATQVSVIQQTTLRTNDVIASALPTIYS